MEEERLLIFTADIHGEFKTLVWELIEHHRISHADVVICGDCGFGFCKSIYYEDLYKKIGPKLEKNDITLYCLRGNHDRLEGYYDGTNLGYSRIKFIKDHEVFELRGLKIYPIGGCHSTDRGWRQSYNKLREDVGSEKRIWWPSETIIKKYKSIPNKVDIIISHQAPISFEPVHIRESWMSEELYKDILDERKYLDYIFYNVRCKYWFFGHHHKSITSSLNGVVYKCLGIMEFFEFK